jgi:asparagine synthase (glutamine-hydrolysing)
LISPALKLAGRAKRLECIQKYATLANLEVPEYYFSRVTSPHDYFNRSKCSLYADGFARTVDTAHSADLTRELFAKVRDQPLLNQMLYVDTKTWLPDDLLVKADKMTMATSVELRVPFLDHKVLEFAATLPTKFKVRGRETKRVLKRAFRSRVPDEILKRKKTGFPVPFGSWLRNDLREFVSDTLLSSAAVTRGYFRRDKIERLLATNGRHGSHASETFGLLVLELWHNRFVDRANG